MENHFVPEFYFVPWLDEQGHLIRFGWMRGKLTRDLKTPGQICYVNDLHTFSRPMGKYTPHAVEHWLTNIDTNAAIAIRQILSGGIESITNEHANHLALFFLSLIVRRPEKVSYLDQRAAEDFKRSLAAHDKQLADDADLSPAAYGFTSLRDYAEQIHPGLIENVGRILITDIIADERYLRRILSMEWWTGLSAVSIGPIVTTDRPLTIVGTGLDDPEVVLVLPLGPRLVLYLTPLGIRRRMIAGGWGPLCLRTMQLLLRSAHRFAYGTPETNQNLIGRYLARS